MRSSGGCGGRWHRRAAPGLTQNFDAIVLDLNLPRMDGLTVCRKLREEGGRDTPVLMLTARDTLEDKLKGFEYGADDYLVKPFALSEVETRLRALHKRYAGRVATRELRVGDLVYKPESHSVEFAGQAVKLPPKCLRILEVLMLQPDKVINRQAMEVAVWGEPQSSSDTVRTQMHTLRRALLPPAGAIQSRMCMDWGIALPHPTKQRRGYRSGLRRRVALTFLLFGLMFFLVANAGRGHPHRATRRKLHRSDLDDEMQRVLGQNQGNGAAPAAPLPSLRGLSCAKRRIA